MTAKEIIIKCLDENTEYPCRNHSCDKPESEGNNGNCCHQCSVDILDEYTAEVRADERRKFAEWLSEKGVINLVGYFCGEPTILELEVKEVLEKYEEEQN